MPKIKMPQSAFNHPYAACSLVQLSFPDHWQGMAKWFILLAKFSENDPERKKKE